MTPAQDHALHRIHDAAPIYLRLTGTRTDVKTSNEADYHDQPPLTFDEFMLHCVHPRPDGAVDVEWSGHSFRIAADGTGLPLDTGAWGTVQDEPSAARKAPNATATRFLTSLRPWQLMAGTVALCAIYLVAFGVLGILSIQAGFLLVVACVLGSLLTGAAAAKQDTSMLLVAVAAHLAAIGAAAATLFG